MVSSKCDPLLGPPRAFEMLVSHRQDIPASMSPQMPHSVAGLAALLRRCGPCA
jgi:hypothetical protein